MYNLLRQLAFFYVNSFASLFLKYGFLSLGLKLFAI